MFLRAKHSPEITPMRNGAVCLVILTATLSLGSGLSHADPYRWCAVYSGGGNGGGRNCGFITLDQCRATISGIGGVCEPNLFYTGPDRDESKMPLRRKQQLHR